jgi:hypothetical protein
MHDLTAFTLQDMARCGAALRTPQADCRSMEEVAQHIVQYFFTNCADKAGRKQCALVRFFKTHPYDGLDPELQTFSKRLIAGQPMPPNLRCLTLLATAGVRSVKGTRVGVEFLRLTSTQKEEERLRQYILNLWVAGTQEARKGAGAAI